MKLKFVGPSLPFKNISYLEWTQKHHNLLPANGVNICLIFFKLSHSLSKFSRLQIGDFFFSESRVWSWQLPPNVKPFFFEENNKENSLKCHLLKFTQHAKFLTSENGPLHYHWYSYKVCINIMNVLFELYNDYYINILHDLWKINLHYSSKYLLTLKVPSKICSRWNSDLFFFFFFFSLLFHSISCEL